MWSNWPWIVGARLGSLQGISETADLWDFHTQQYLEFAENGAKNEKHPVSSSYAGKNISLMREVSVEGQFALVNNNTL